MPLGRLIGLIQYFCFPGRVDITEENCEDLLTAADMLSVTGVVAACCLFLRQKFQPENCIGKNSDPYCSSCGEDSCYIFFLRDICIAFPALSSAAA